jgi:hypothetical protein
MKKQVFSLFLLFSSLTYAIDFNETIECDKGEVYFLEDDENKLINKAIKEFEYLDKSCEWGEMLDLTKQERCTDFTARLNTFNDSVENINTILDDIREMHKGWEKYKLCRNSLRFDAKNFQFELNKKISLLETQINSYEDCKNDIAYNKSLNCKVRKVYTDTTPNILGSDKINKNPFKKYKKKTVKNPFKKYNTIKQGKTNLVLKPL